MYGELSQSVAPFLVKDDQAVCSRDHYIGCSVRHILDIYEYTEGKDIPSALLFVDFEKAFKTVEHLFIISVLRKKKFVLCNFVHINYCGGYQKTIRFHLSH